MTQEQFQSNASNPGHYKDKVNCEPTINQRASRTEARYTERLEQQLKELASEDLPCTLSQEEQSEILTEVIEEALLEVVMACKNAAVNCGLPEGKAVAEHIQRQLCGVTRMKP